MNKEEPSLLCQFSDAFKNEVSKFLDLEHRLNRKIREETLTDLLVCKLLILNNPNIHVDLPDEIRTGADLEIVVLNEDENYAVSFLLQAKRVSKSTSNKSYYYYKHLDHKKCEQCRQLIAHAKTQSSRIITIPMYIFYNSDFCISHYSSKYKGVSGVNLMAAECVYDILTRIGNVEAKKIETLASNFLDLSDLFCLRPFWQRHPNATQYSSGAAFGARNGAKLVTHLLNNLSHAADRWRKTGSDAAGPSDDARFTPPGTEKPRVEGGGTSHLSNPFARVLAEGSYRVDKAVITELSNPDSVVNGLGWPRVVFDMSGSRW